MITAISMLLSIESCRVLTVEDDVQEFGPIEPPKEEIRVAPYSLPANYEWDEVDILDADQVCTSIPSFY